MGWLSDIFGGGGTTVQQQAANNTTVTVQNIMDLTGLTDVLQQLGLMQQQTAQAQADATKQQAQATQQGAAVLAAAIVGAEQAQLQQAQSVQDKIMPWLRLVATVTVVYLAAKVWKAWR